MNFFTKSSWLAGVGVVLLGSTALAEEPLPVESVGSDEDAPAIDKAEVVGRDAAASSETLSACVASHENAQLARLSGGFLEALSHLARCSDRTCPEALREDCLEWQNELRDLIPGVVIVVRGPTGDIDDAKVFVDGHLVLERLDGRKLSMDPGKHLIRVEREGGLAQERTLVLTEGEGTRRVVFEFENNRFAPAETMATLPQDTARPVPALSYVFGGAAVVSLGLFVGFGSSALKTSKQAKSTCAPVCDPRVSRAVNERAAFADVALGVSVLSLAGAALFYAYRPEVTVAKKGTSLDVRAWRDGGQVLLRGEL